MHSKFLSGYTFCIPEAYGDSIRLEHFSPGDVFYDKAAAYELPWSEALKHFTMCIQVVNASSFQKIKIKILKPNHSQTTLELALEKDVSASGLRNILLSGNINEPNQ